MLNILKFTFETKRETINFKKVPKYILFKMNKMLNINLRFSFFEIKLCFKK